MKGIIDMEPNEKISKPISKRSIAAVTVISYILLLVQLCGSIYVLFASNALDDIIYAVIAILAVAAALVYFLIGCKKDAAKYYKAFYALYALSLLASQIGVLFSSTPLLAPISVVLSMIVYGNVLLLTFAKDFGKKTSYILCGINVLLFLGAFIFEIITLFAFEGVVGIILTACWLVESCVAGLMTVMKYYDKQKRNA